MRADEFILDYLLSTLARICVAIAGLSCGFERYRPVLDCEALAGGHQHVTGIDDVRGTDRRRGSESDGKNQPFESKVNLHLLGRVEADSPNSYLPYTLKENFFNRCRTAWQRMICPTQIDWKMSVGLDYKGIWMCAWARKLLVRGVTSVPTLN